MPRLWQRSPARLFPARTLKRPTCGHDTHTAMLGARPKFLMENKDKVKGRVKFMFQPGEEGYNGCKTNDRVRHFEIPIGCRYGDP